MIDLLLKKYNNFEECTIKSISISDYGLKVEIVVDYIWENKNGIKEIGPNKNLVLMKFTGVQELLIRNNFNDDMINYPTELNWGINEFSLVKLENNPDILAKYQNSMYNFKHLAFLWEDERRIDIVFINLEITNKLRLIK